jgi:microcystin-dependent protein
MSPYVGEIRIFGGNFAPAGWMLCQGQLLPISENETLFNLIGTTYGGDGQLNFALPDLQGRVPTHQGTSQQGVTYVIGQKAGVESVTLTVNQLPSHSHTVQTATAAQGGAVAVPASNTVLADETLNPAPAQPPAAYLPPGGAQVALGPKSIASTGGSQPHDNMQPFLVINFIISLFGIFPSPN